MGCARLRAALRFLNRRRAVVKRFDRSGLEWPLAADLDNAQLEAKLYGAAGVKPRRRRLPAPDWAAVHRELKRKHVTRQTLWEEYIEAPLPR